jgi:hypothetical protein
MDASVSVPAVPALQTETPVAELEKQEAEKAMLNRKVSLDIRSIRVANTVSGGGAWDRGSDADVRLTIKLDSTTYSARKTDDKNSVTYDQKAGEVSVGDQIEIDVNDADLYYNDLIGKATHKITAEDLQNGSVNLKFGSVESLQLDFKP